jgi:hypothetical protein
VKPDIDLGDEALGRALRITLAEVVAAEVSETSRQTTNGLCVHQGKVGVAGDHGIITIFMTP